MTTTDSPQAQPPEAAELKPCPFCGEVPVANNYYMNQGDKWGGVVCGNCGVQGPEVRTGYAPWEHWKWAAVKEWNSRADLPRAAADDDARKRAREIIGNVNNYAEESTGELSISAFGPLAERIAAALTAARVETGLSVEAALAELRELTPHCCNVSFLTTGGVAITVYANSIVPLELLRTERTTLEEAMNQVRAWAKSQRARSERR